MSTMFTFSIFSVIFLAIGVVLYVMSDQIIEISMRYDDFCSKTPVKTHTGEKEKCKQDFATITEAIQGPIYVYY